jgi:sodium-dependent dicarboxylate transporter 2/3/5
MPTPLNKSKSLWRIAGILAFIAALSLPMPVVISGPARVVLGMTLWMAIYWISEAVPLAVASLIPLVILPVFAVMPMDVTARFYADPNIFLFMGGFFLALAMEKCALQKRIALHLIGVAGSGPRGLLGGFLMATAFISMWVSNTATTMMMLPIALAVIAQLKKNPQGASVDPRFSTSLMLGIAYASNIGGIATLVGTPPNMIFAGQVKTLFPHFPEISFVSWFLLCLPGFI